MVWLGAQPPHKYDQILKAKSQQEFEEIISADEDLAREEESFSNTSQLNAPNFTRVGYDTRRTLRILFEMMIRIAMGVTIGYYVGAVIGHYIVIGFGLSEWSGPSSQPSFQDLSSGAALGAVIGAFIGVFTGVLPKRVDGSIFQTSKMIVYVALINFLLFWVIGVFIFQGDALNGKVEAGHYYLFVKRIGGFIGYEEVNYFVFMYSKLHGLSVFATHLLFFPAAVIYWLSRPSSKQKAR
jgi:hypothetical protein